VAIKFLDTFTDPNGTDLLVHAPDFPLLASWSIAPGVQEIQSNEVQSTVAPPSGGAPVSDAVIAYGVGDDISCDIYRNTSFVGAEQDIIFCAGATGVLSDHLRFTMYNIDAANIGFHLARRAGGVDFDEILATDPSMPTMALAVGAPIKLGITVIDGTHHELWWEPPGGGTRTQIVLDDGGTYTDVNGHWVTSLSHVGNPLLVYLAFTYQTFGAGGANQSRKDNLTVEGDVWSPPTPPPGSTTWTPPVPAPGLTAWGDC